MRRCFIHIGHPKTATTYLQHCLHLNASLFRAHGYWVPDTFSHLGFYDLEPLSRDGAVISGNLAPLFILMSEGTSDQKPAMLDYLFAAPDKPPDSDIILSSELFFYYGNAVSEVARAAHHFGYQPVIMAWLPRQDRAAVTGFLQNVRNHAFCDGVVEFLTHNSHMRYCRYLRPLRAIEAGTPGVQFILRSFDRAFLAGGDIFTDFLAAIGSDIDEGDCSRPSATANEGLLLEQYELLRAAALMRRPDVAERLRGGDATLTANQRQRVHAYYYRPYVRDFLEQHYMPENRELLDRFMPNAGAAERAYWQQTDPPLPLPTLDEDLLAHLRAAFA